MSGDAFTVRLNRLFDTVRDSDGEPFTNLEIVSRMNAAGYTVTPGYLSQLRKGIRNRPSIVHIEGLARAFGVSAAYFFNDAPVENDNAAVGELSDEALVDADVKLMAMRTAQLSEEGRRQVLLLVDKIRAHEVGLHGEGIPGEGV